jgi:hypothetical protein
LSIITRYRPALLARLLDEILANNGMVEGIKSGIDASEVAPDRIEHCDYDLIPR